MDLRPVCCEPCEARRFCRPEGNCCLECHFSYEEELAFPFLPMAWRDRLAREHDELQAAGFPDAAVARHAAMEEKVFRKYCPEAVCEIIERDHVEHGHGRLMSREVPLTTPLVAPQPALAMNTATVRAPRLFSARWARATR